MKKIGQGIFSKEQIGLDKVIPHAIGSLFMVGMLIFCWLVRGPDHPVYGLIVVGWTLPLGVVVAVPVMLHLPAWWFRVSPGEHLLHRILGVGVFGWLLDRSGWNRHVALPWRGFNGTRATLHTLELSVRAGASGHGACFAIHILFAAFALFTGHQWGALWILLPGVIVHLYPVLLQRSIMLRLQPVLDKFRAAESSP
jgi:hypothetical protein